MGHKPILLKQESNNQINKKTRINKLGKYPYNKKQRSRYKF